MVKKGIVSHSQIKETKKENVVEEHKSKPNDNSEDKTKESESADITKKNKKEGKDSNSKEQEKIPEKQEKALEEKEPAKEENNYPVQSQQPVDFVKLPAEKLYPDTKDFIPAENEDPIQQTECKAPIEKHDQEGPITKKEVLAMNPIIVNLDENFWMEGNYKNITKRIDDGARIVDDLGKMVHERAEIESQYAAWWKKWSDNQQKTFEYCTAYPAMLNGLKEADSLADLHMSIYSKLEGLSKNILEWKNERYAKTLTKIKEVKRSEDAFAKTQKPWAAKHNEVLKCMTAYHCSYNVRNTAEKNFQESETRPDVTSEQKTKLKEKWRKTEQDIETTLDKYKEALRDISNYNPKYQDDMKYEFARCQAFEKVRKEFIKEKLLLYHSCVDRSIFNKNYESIYAELATNYHLINPKEDLAWFQASYGDTHPFTKLEFVEYDADVHQQALQKQNKNAPVRSKSKASGICATL